MKWIMNDKEIIKKWRQYCICNNTGRCSACKIIKLFNNQLKKIKQNAWI